MLDCMRRYPSFLIELEDEEAAKRFVSFAEARGVGEPFREAVDLFAGADAAVEAFGGCCRGGIVGDVGAGAGSPADGEAFVLSCG